MRPDGGAEVDREASGTSVPPSDRVSSRYVEGWRIDVTVRAGVPRVLPVAVLARLAVRGLVRAGAPSPASLGLVLSDDAELAALNRETFGHRGPTDVLSFPLLPPDAFPPHEGSAGTPGDEVRGARPGRHPAFVLPPGQRPNLGDIVLSVERAIEQAASGTGGQANDRAWAASDEVRLLVVHGVLHVCGWDHADTREGEAMRALEAEILAMPDGTAAR